MSIEEKSIPNSCRNAKIPIGKISKIRDIFNTKAMQAIEEKNNSTYQKRKNSSKSNSQDKNINHETKSPSGKNLIQVLTQNSFLNSQSMDFAQQLSETLPEIVTGELNNEVESISEKEQLPVRDEIIKVQRPNNEKNRFKKRHLNVNTSNLDEQEITHETRVGALIDPFKFTPNYAVVIKFNQENNKFDVMPFVATQNEITSKLVLNKDDVMNVKNQENKMIREISFDFIREFTRFNLLTIDNTDKEPDRSPFISEYSILENNYFELEHFKIREQIAIKWSKENEISSEINKIYLKKPKKLFYPEKINEVSINRQEKRDLHIESNPALEILVNNKENKLLIMNKIDNITIPCQKKYTPFITEKNIHFELNLSTKRTCECLPKWKNNLELGPSQNFTIVEKKYKNDIILSQNDNFCYFNCIKETEHKISKIAFGIICQNNENKLVESNHNHFVILGEENRFIDYKIENNDEVYYFPIRKTFSNSDCQNDKTNLKMCIIEELSFINKKGFIDYIACQNDIKFEFITEKQSNSNLSSSLSSNQIIKSFPETLKEKMLDYEIHQFDLVFERKYNKFEKDIVQESIKSINLIHKEKYFKVQINESVNLIKKSTLNQVISLSSTLAFPQKRKKYIMINYFVADYKTTFKISILSILLVIFLFCLIFSISSCFNFISAYFSKSYFKNEKLFKWDLVYSKTQ